jgi:o-succinylbenzoate---CoA ligase
MTMHSKNNTTINSLRIKYSSPSCIEDIQSFLNEWHDESKQIILQTSGSTGDKKLTSAEKKHLIASAKMTGRFFNFSENTQALICLPLNFVSGKMMAIRCLVFNMKAIISPAGKPLDFPDNVVVDFAAMTPYQYDKALHEHPEKTRSIKTILLGGAPISEQLRMRIIAMNQDVFHSYGMTETYSHIALRRINQNNEPFQVLPGISCSQAPDETLVIRAPFLGINELKTNDLVSFVGPDSFHFLGRKDFVVNSGGIKLHPEELEKKLSPLNWTFNYFFFGLSDETFGEKLVLFVETEQVIDVEKLKAILSKYEQPKTICNCDAFVYTESGKVNRKLTAEKFSI